MESKSLIWIGLAVGSTLGGFVPALWGSSFLSMSGVVFSAVGGFAGIYFGYKLGR